MALYKKSKLLKVQTMDRFYSEKLPGVFTSGELNTQRECVPSYAPLAFHLLDNRPLVEGAKSINKPTSLFNNYNNKHCQFPILQVILVCISNNYLMIVALGADALFSITGLYNEDFSMYENG